MGNCILHNHCVPVSSHTVPRFLNLEKNRRTLVLSTLAKHSAEKRPNIQPTDRCERKVPFSPLTTIDTSSFFEDFKHQSFVSMIRLTYSACSLGAFRNPVYLSPVCVLQTGADQLFQEQHFSNFCCMLPGVNLMKSQDLSQVRINS